MSLYTFCWLIGDLARLTQGDAGERENGRCYLDKCNRDEAKMLSWSYYSMTPSALFVLNRGRIELPVDDTLDAQYKYHCGARLVHICLKVIIRMPSNHGPILSFVAIVCSVSCSAC
ncbi:hypothetical protein HBI81_034630 [Parastagonospora nodorum]|nr:hypothetical protein HBH53_004550 [Parastagonospora nodorum]KAH4058424.1 hypothetical protein HBH49_032860 [Parastagonospora nodorum]KAH4132642.1 hypothetical protein HBH47_008610 [Parastagonospora nodorum]KAH4238538.1 hypothetical protein HBI06_040480 [Parastagonospora nodorum]KAH4271742.1 hypothetical protein HBI03_035770 [Parastagonospora nodorum]